MTHQVGCSLSSFRDLSDAQGQHGAAPSFPILILIELAIQIKLKIDQLRRAQCHDYLSLVGSRADDCLALWDFPLVDSMIIQDVPDTLWTCRRASLPICWTANVGAEDKNPVSWTSSMVSPIDRTRVPLTNERIMYDSNSSNEGDSVYGRLLG